MIALYFDYDFVDLLNERDDSQNLIINDFLNQFLRKIRGVEVFVNFSSLDELKDRVLRNLFWNYISEIGPIKLLDFKPLLDSSKFYKKGALTKILFVESCDENQLQKSYSSIFISNSSLLTKWPLFMSNRDDSELLIKSTPSSDEHNVFKSWADLNSFAHPIRNMILVDFYIASDKANQRISDNLIPLIKSLLTANSRKANDLAIITKDLASTINSGSNVSWTLSDIEQSLKSLSQLQILLDKIEFINYNSSKVTTDPEHNRYLITNYFMIQTQAGFNIFKSKKGIINKRDRISFHSLLNNRTRNEVKEITDNLKTYCKKVDSESKNYKGETEYFYLPPLQSRFLRDSD